MFVKFDFLTRLVMIYNPKTALRPLVGRFCLCIPFRLSNIIFSRIGKIQNCIFLTKLFF